MSDTVDHVRSLLPGVRIGRPENLGGSERSEVLRVRAQWPDREETSLIIKTFLDAGEGWARESAALSVLDAGAPASVLVTESAVPPTVVLSDLGPGGSLADLLLADDAGAASDGVLAWAGAVGGLHRATLGSEEIFRAALRARAGGRDVAARSIGQALIDAAAELERQCAELGVVVPPGALRSLRDLPRRLGEENCALTPGDTCPDNNVLVPDGLRLIDFEGAEWRHIAWDVAYLTVPWPSCWCAWRIPADAADRALERYRTCLEDVLPYVRSTEFRGDVADAATGWALLSAAWFLPRALADDPPPSNRDLQTPKRRPMIVHRLAFARRNERVPELAELATRLRTALVERWGEPHLALAPAFDESD